MEELWGWRKSNKLFWEGDSRGATVPLEVRQAKQEPAKWVISNVSHFSSNLKYWDLILCAMRNKQRLEKKLAEKQGMSKTKYQSFSSRLIQNEKKMFHGNCQISAYVFPYNV